jgi:hypothetical protein
VGAHPYWYFVKHQTNVQQALDELREREFRAGRYNPVIPFLSFQGGAQGLSPGPRHASIAEALEDAAEDGTRSILDIETVADEPDFGMAAPLDPELLEELYETTRPTRRMIEENMDFLEDVERGHCVYTVVYKDGKPDELFFAGYSFD